MAHNKISIKDCSLVGKSFVETTKQPPKFNFPDLERIDERFSDSSTGVPETVIVNITHEARACTNHGQLTPIDPFCMEWKCSWLNRDTSTGSTVRLIFWAYKGIRFVVYTSSYTCVIFSYMLLNSSLVADMWKRLDWGCSAVFKKREWSRCLTRKWSLKD